MKEKIRVFMVDDSKNVVNEVKKYFSSHAVIDIVGVAHDGKEALNHLLTNHNKYDFVIMDLIIPKMDGVSVIEELNKNNIHLKSIVTTSMKSDEVVRKCMEIGVNYFLLKPYDYEALEKHIIDIMRSKSLVSKPVNDIRQSITTLLHSLGVPSHIKGYEYIRDGINLMYENPSMIGAITKELYPEIASKYDTTSSRVERAIRHAIEVSWSRGDYELMENIFGHSVDYDKAKPTNSEFLATLTDKLKLDLNIFE